MGGIAIQRFELTVEEEAILIARWVITRGDRDWSGLKEVRFSRPTGVEPKEKGYDRQVAALSAVLGDLSSEISVALKQRIAEQGR